jgi:hypothetical protein
MPLYNLYATEGQDLKESAWLEFWSKVKFILFELYLKLDDGGYGFSDKE